MAYIGTQPKDIRSFGKAKFDFTATQGQTAFTGADDDGKTLGFTAGQVSVYVNGILMDDSDYTASNGNTITLTSAANASDIISVVALQTDIPNSDYVPATGGTFSGDVTHTGAFTSRGIDDNATSTAMTLDASGNLLVGTTSTTPAVSNDSDGIALQSNGTVQFSANATTTAIINRKATDGAILQFRKDGTTVGSIGSNGGSRLYIESGDVGLRLLPDQDDIRPSYNSGASRDAAIDLGDGLARFKDLYLSGGVYLGGTGSANKLDDYEEGLFQTSLTTSGGQTYTLNSSSDTLAYTKVGNVVHVGGQLNVTAKPSSPSGRLMIALPFVVLGSSSPDEQFAGSITVGAVTTSAGAWECFASSGSSVANVYRADTTSISTNNDNCGPTTSTSTIFFSLTYRTS